MSDAEEAPGSETVAGASEPSAHAAMAGVQ